MTVPDRGQARRTEAKKSQEVLYERRSAQEKKERKGIDREPPRKESLNQIGRACTADDRSQEEACGRPLLVYQSTRITVIPGSTQRKDRCENAEGRETHGRLSENRGTHTKKTSLHARQHIVISHHRAQGALVASIRGRDARRYFGMPVDGRILACSHIDTGIRDCNRLQWSGVIQ
jgi:hypothetical protein